jgi:lipopolysaccharide assembly protein A
VKKAKIWIALALLVLLIVLVLQNTESVSTRFLFFTFTLPRATLLALTMLTGIVIGLLLAMAVSARRHQRRSDQHPE